MEGQSVIGSVVGGCLDCVLKNQNQDQSGGIIRF